ncbi:uncharacterized protein J4E88_009996 [Alternaria novae-zelandiae]|uniref:uncharacterized protein n=1 Tax=Alternaria novae-zelandiae TaxID=430562 RepID=UPI0020C26F22|nr:uncharacterized protein J4E88_009996 [Alternaria novae-zelandiae]KAI4669713.1 hypothetical protein J4E88_009996 [Alternaria novae-zelandiae]
MLVESECQADQLEEDIYEDCYLLGSEHDPAIFDLFVQWLYTRKYQEKEELVESLASRKSLASPLPNSEDVSWIIPPDGVMDWAVKAAILCWELGASLRAKGFQNYAMERLFEALSSPFLHPLMANLILHTYEVENEGTLHGTSPLQRLIQDVIVRNWGDDDVVDHVAGEAWSNLLKTCPYFRKVFISATKQSLEERRKHQMSLENYLIR